MNIKKEILIYITIIIIFALIQHPDILSSPIQRFSELPKAGAYGIGALHPLVFGFFIYLIVSFFRWIFSLIKRAFVK
jgi:hypothetical protein